jgi:hypothetical protein
MYGMSKNNIFIKNLIETKNDSLIQIRTESGEIAYQNNVLELQNLEQVKYITSKDSIIEDLKILIEKNKKLLAHKNKVITIIKTETKIDTIVKTNIVHTDSNIVFKNDIYGKWFELHSVVNKDSGNFIIKTHSKLNLIIGYKRKNIFKKYKPYAIINDENPYTDISDMKVIHIKEENKKSKFGFGIYTGYGLTKVNNDIKIGFQIGGGLMYKF